MTYQQLGHTDMQVSAIAMGCWAIAGGATWGDQDEADALATIQTALDVGVNFFDTAEGYGEGESEALVGRALQGRRQEAVIATKVGGRHLSAQDVQYACEASLRRLQTEYIDLYQIHWPNRSVPLAETLDAFETLREQGKIRAMGVSNFGVQDLTELLTITTCEANQLPYSLLWRAIEYEIQPLCRMHGVGILCYSALVQGLLTGKFASADDVPVGRARTRHFSPTRPMVNHGEAGCETDVFAALGRIQDICAEIHAPMTSVALAWLLKQPGVTSVIAGARTPAQIRDNIQAVDLALPDDILTALQEATAELKRILGPNPDMWRSDSRFR